MVEIDDPIAHRIRTQNIDEKINMIIEKQSEIDDKLYALVKANPEAMKKLEALNELREKMKAQ